MKSKLPRLVHGERKIMQKDSSLEGNAPTPEPNTLPDHELNPVVAGLEAHGFVPSSMFGADSDVPGLGNWGVQVGEMNAEERKASLRELGILSAD
jgi:hypothetical protein